MSNATAESPAIAARPPVMQTIEQAYCANDDVCGAVIAPAFVFSNLIPAKGVEPTRRVVKAWCQHCDTAMEETYVLRGGTWCREGAGSPIVTDERKRRGILARVANVRGDVQRAVDA